MGVLQQLGASAYMCCCGRIFGLRAFFRCGRRKLRRVSRELLEECIPVPPWSSSCDKDLAWSDMECREDNCVMVGCCATLRPRIQRHSNEEHDMGMMPVCNAPLTMSSAPPYGFSLSTTSAVPAPFSAAPCPSPTAMSPPDFSAAAPSAAAVPMQASTWDESTSSCRPSKSLHALLEMQRALDRLADAVAAESSDEETGPALETMPAPKAAKEDAPLNSSISPTLTCHLERSSSEDLGSLLSSSISMGGDTSLGAAAFGEGDSSICASPHNTPLNNGGSTWGGIQSLLLAAAEEGCAGLPACVATDAECDMWASIATVLDDAAGTRAGPATFPHPPQSLQMLDEAIGSPAEASSRHRQAADVCTCLSSGGNLDATVRAPAGTTSSSTASSGRGLLQVSSAEELVAEPGTGAEPAAEPEPAMIASVGRLSDSFLEEHSQYAMACTDDELDECDFLITEEDNSEEDWVCIREMSVETPSISSDDEAVLCTAPTQGEMEACEVSDDEAMLCAAPTQGEMEDLVPPGWLLVQAS